MQRPNILYFVCHDIGRHLPMYHVPVPAPNLDRFAQQSIVLEQMHCASAACTPSRNCAMTGLPAHQSGGIGLAHMGWPLPQSVRTITDYLNEAGYETIHSGMQHERHPRTNPYQVDLQSHWNDGQARRGVEKALAYLAQRDRSRPFYLNIGTQEPHPSTWGKAEERFGGVTPPEKVYLPPAVPDTPLMREKFGQFQSAIRYLDEHWGRLINGLKELGHDRDTLVVFTTDHGINHGRGKGTLYDAGTEIACLVRMPEGQHAARRESALLSNLDFLPTFLEAAGAEIPEGLGGKSFLPLLEGNDWEPHSAIFTERNFHGETRIQAPPGDPFSLPTYVDRFDPVRAIRTGTYHYIRWFDPGVKPRAPLPWEFESATGIGDPSEPWEMPRKSHPRPAEELYLVARDPYEHFNVAAQPEFAAIKQDLANRLQAWMKATDDFVIRGEVPQRYEAPGWGEWDAMPWDEAEAEAKGLIPTTRLTS